MPGEHREYLELLPWYVNGTLAADERGAVERHLDGCLPCNAALREERRLQGQIRAEDTAPFGPEHGVRELFRRIDRDARRAGRRASRFGLRSPVLGYGLAAVFGGMIVASWFLLARGPGADDAAFATLSTAADSASARIDVVFAAPPSETEMQRFLDDIGGDIGAELVAGPSELGRYTFAVGLDDATGLTRLLEDLNEDTRVRFAGRSFIPEPDAAGESP